MTGIETINDAKAVLDKHLTSAPENAPTFNDGMAALRVLSYLRGDDAIAAEGILIRVARDSHNVWFRHAALKRLEDMIMAEREQKLLESKLATSDLIMAMIAVLDDKNIENYKDQSGNTSNNTAGHMVQTHDLARKVLTAAMGSKPSQDTATRWLEEIGKRIKKPENKQNGVPERTQAAQSAPAAPPTVPAPEPAPAPIAPPPEKKSPQKKIKEAAEKTTKPAPSSEPVEPSREEIRTFLQTVMPKASPPAPTPSAGERKISPSLNHIQYMRTARDSSDTMLTREKAFEILKNHKNAPAIECTKAINVLSKPHMDGEGLAPENVVRAFIAVARDNDNAWKRQRPLLWLEQKSFHGHDHLIPEMSAAMVAVINDFDLSHFKDEVGHREPLILEQLYHTHVLALRVIAKGLDVNLEKWVTPELRDGLEAFLKHDVKGPNVPLRHREARESFLRARGLWTRADTILNSRKTVEPMPNIPDARAQANPLSSPRAI